MSGRATIAIAIATLALGCNSKPSEPAAPPPPVVADARPRPDADTRPDAVVIDGRPADARPYVERMPCPYDNQELEAAARSAWGPPPDAGVVAHCTPAVAPDAAWILWGYASLDNRYELHVTLVKATPGHSVLADDSRRTTNRDEVEGPTATDEVEAFDLDDDGIEEVLFIHTQMGAQYGKIVSSTMTILTMRNGAFTSGPPVPLAAPGCFSRHELDVGPPRRIVITTRADHPGAPGCPPDGRHRYVWDPGTLALTEH